MSVEKFSFQKAIPIIVITWILSLVTTLALVYVVVPIITPTIDSDRLADSAVITTKLADGSVTSAKIVNGAIMGQDLADGSIITVNIDDGAVTTAKIANGSVTSEKLAAGAVVNVNLANGSVTSGKLADNAVITVKMADGSVTSAKILDATITTADLADGVVTSVKIANGAITTAKIANYAVTNTKLSAYAIPFNSTSSIFQLDKTTSTWENITDMEVKLTLQRNSTLLIFFSTQTAANAPTVSVIWRARVNATIADPGEFFAQPPSVSSSYWASLAYNFMSEVNPGEFTIYIQWSVYGSDTAWVGKRTLFVVALPT